MKLEISPEILRKMPVEERAGYAQWASTMLEAVSPHRLNNAEIRSYTRMTGTPMKGHKPSLDSLRRCGKEVDTESEGWIERIWNCAP
jgi:hypothetical protein